MIEEEVDIRYRIEHHSDTYTDPETGETETDEWDEVVPYEYYILNVTLTNKNFGYVITESGSISTTCFAASAESTEKETKAEVTQSKESATTADDAAKAADTEATIEEEPPYTVEIDEDGNYTFSFGDWEWSTDSDEDTGTDAEVNDKVKSYLNLRSGSGMEYKIIGHLLSGEKVQVVSTEGDWYQVTIPERSGYLYKDYVDMLEAEEKSGKIDEEFLTMMLYLMMSSMNDTRNTTPLTPDGNLTLVDDIGSTSGESQQFITLVTKAGNYFYLIIDCNEKGEENIRFLNMVDEADLFTLMDEDQVATYQTAQDAAKAEEEVAVTTPTTPDATEQEAETEPEVKEKKSVNMLPLMGIIVNFAACGGGYFYLETKKKKTSEVKPDPDADYTDENGEEEFEIPEDDGEEEPEIEYLDEEDPVYNEDVTQD